MSTPKLASALTNMRRVLPLMRDERVPTGLKVATGAVALLILSPLDIFGDIPVLGLLDDAVLLTLLAMLFVALATRMTERVVTPQRVARASTPEPGVMQLPRARPIDRPR
ncbi:MAG TPA: YkvA family protein [Candidatus Baltobacteraceae bacterium]|nr:YkvA family protein [Candidatus Baltobacteraceae bacterium]